LAISGRSMSSRIFGVTGPMCLQAIPPPRSMTKVSGTSRRLLEQPAPLRIGRIGVVVGRAH